MIKLDTMLIIGSAGANVGKTELACALIRKFSAHTRIIGIKVTTIREQNGKCPRGAGCGVCSSLDGNFVVTEETNVNSDKDTSRLLAAGASRVFWLRVLKTHLKEGLSALLDVIGPDVVSICESNSLRQIVEPGLFLVVKGSNLKAWKDSARHVKKYADRIVVSTGTSFDLGLDRVKLVGRRWAIQEKATAIIMAGGRSTRMGQDKSMLPVKSQQPPFCDASQKMNAEPIIKHIFDQLRPHFDQILISSDDASKYGFLGAEVIEDQVPGRGPLMGMASALKASANEVSFVTACDIPHIEMTLVRTMLRQIQGYDAVIPKTGPLQYEPLFAVYRKRVFTAIEDALSSGRRRIIDALDSCRVKYIKLDDAQSLENLNTADDYVEFIRKQKHVDL